MKRKMAERLTIGAAFAYASAPFWLTAGFAVANIHDSVTVGRDGTILSRPVLRQECAESACFTFDKAGVIAQSKSFGTGISHRFDAYAKPTLTLYVAMPKMGMVVPITIARPSAEQLDHARTLHQTACTVVERHKISGYSALNCVR